VRSSLSRVVSVVVLVWALTSVAVVWRNAAARGSDSVTSIEQEFRALARVLPPSGAVGFLRFAADDDSVDHTMVFYLAQYALAPRLVEKRTDLEFLVVARGAMRPGRDDRLAGFEPVASSKEGYRVYQRRVK
jgi:hypothetical protein